MSKLSSKLSNCYVPLKSSAIQRPSGRNPNETELLQISGRDSGDGTKTARQNHTLRRLVIESGIQPSAQGSTLVEIGHTKVMCDVHGPVTSTSAQIPSSVQFSMDEGTLYCEVKYLPHVGYPASALVESSVSPLDQSQFSFGRLNSQINTRETDLSSRVLSALSSAVPLQHYAKCAIVVRLTVLQDDGGALSACILAASLALTNASVEIYDLVTSCSVAVTSGHLLADPDMEEEYRADAIVTLAILPNWKEVTLWEQTGQLPPAVANQALDLCRDGCRTMHRFSRDHVLEQR